MPDSMQCGQRTAKHNSAALHASELTQQYSSMPLMLQQNMFQISDHSCWSVPDLQRGWRKSHNRLLGG